MKKFILQFSLLSFLLYGSFWLIYFLFPNAILDRGYPIFKYQIESITSSENIEVLFLGDSRVVSSLNPQLIPNSKNAGLVGSNPIESYFLLKKYLNNEKSQIKKVMLSFAWPRMGLKYWPDVLIWRGGLYDFYSFDEYQEILKIAEEKDPQFLDQFNTIDFYMAKLKFPQFIGSHIKNSFFQNQRNNREIYDKIKDQKGYINGIWSKKKVCDKCVANEALLSEFRLKPIYAYFLEEIFKLCQEKNIQVIYENIPFNHSSEKHFNPRVIQQYTDFINSLALKYPQHQLSDRIFFFPDTHFEDNHHMNAQGAREYSNYVKEKFLGK